MRLPVLKAGGEATGRSPSPPRPARTLSHLHLNDRLTIQTCLCLCGVKLMSYKGVHHEGRNYTAGGRQEEGVPHTQPDRAVCQSENSFRLHLHSNYLFFPDSHAQFIITEHLPSPAGGDLTPHLRKSACREGRTNETRLHRFCFRAPSAELVSHGRPQLSPAQPATSDPPYRRHS